MGFSLVTRYCGQRPVTCNARSLLFAAQASLERGSVVEAGCELREAIRVWLLAECEYYGCLPKEGRRRGKSAPVPPRVLAGALRRSGELSRDHFEWVVEMIDVGNKAAHLEAVLPGMIASCVDVVHGFLDSSKYLIQPAAAGRLS